MCFYIPSKRFCEKDLLQDEAPQNCLNSDFWETWTDVWNLKLFIGAWSNRFSLYDSFGEDSSFFIEEVVRSNNAFWSKYGSRTSLGDNRTPDFSLSRYFLAIFQQYYSMNRSTCSKQSRQFVLQRLWDVKFGTDAIALGVIPCRWHTSHEGRSQAFFMTYI